jgi:type VI secretion system secreted protein Hcp
MASNILLKLTNIEGESKDAHGHEKEIELLSFSWGMTQSATEQSAMGGGGVAANYQDLSCSKYADKSTPNLIMYSAKGTPISEAKLTVRKAGDNPQDFYIYTMNQCIVSSVQLGGSGDAAQMVDSFSLNFAKIKIEYMVQTETGSVEAGPEVTVDIKASEVT